MRWLLLQLTLAIALDVIAERPLKGDRFTGCLFEIVMLEKQPLGSSFNEKAYWSMNALLNKAYADRHGYGFTIAKPEHESQRWAQRPSESWFRVPFMQERLQAAQARNGKCGWLLYMDSSAFILDHSVPLSKYLDEVFTEQVRDLRTGGIFQWDAKKKLVSDKVFFLQVNGHGESLMSVWRSSTNADQAMRFEDAESGTLTEMLYPGKVTTRSARALKLFQSSHAKIVGKLEAKATVLEKGWNSFIMDTSELSPGLKRKRSKDLLLKLGLLERFPERLSGLRPQAWPVPDWHPDVEPHRGQALVGREAHLQATSTSTAPSPLVLPEVDEENVEVEEQEIQEELAET